MSSRSPEGRSEWEEMLRKIGLGAGLHEPLRTKVIESSVENLAEVLAEHDRKVAEQAWDDACEALGEEEEGLDRYDLVSNVRLANPHRQGKRVHMQQTAFGTCCGLFYGEEGWPSGGLVVTRMEDVTCPECRKS